MIIALVGANGMLGYDFSLLLKDLPHQTFPFDMHNIDIASLESIQKTLSPINPDIIINCAAYTKVDDCETNQQLTFNTNTEGPKNLALFAKKVDIPLIHFSTDYVFDGTKKEPYLETDTCNPQSIYGHSKLKGEIVIQENISKYYIFRIQWLYGINGNHFIKTITNLAKSKNKLKVVSDQWGSPTWTKEVIRSVLSILEHKVDYGIYHLANQGYTNWCDFAKFIIKEQNISCQIQAQTSKDFPRPAKRPLNSRLCLDKYLDLNLHQTQSWQNSVKNYLEETK